MKKQNTIIGIIPAGNIIQIWKTKKLLLLLQDIPIFTSILCNGTLIVLNHKNSLNYNNIKEFSFDIRTILYISEFSVISQ